MTKKSKVTQAQADGTWNGKYGLMYKYEIAFENGDTGEYSSKSENQNKFVVGQEAEYTLEAGQYGNKIKPVSTFTQGGYTPVSKGSDRELSIVRQSSLKCATDYVIANGGDIAAIIHNADVLTKWVQTGELPAAAPVSKDLPF